MYDVIIVGAGPGGAYAAKKLSKLGYKVLLMEKERIPRDKPCGGWITSKLLNYLDWNTNNLDITMEPIDSGVMWLEDDDGYHAYTTKFNKPISYGIIRSEFDKRIVDDATAAGADFLDKNKVVDVIITKDKVKVINSHGREFLSRLIIGADGTYSIVAKKSEIRDRWKPEELTLCCVSETKLGHETKNLTNHYGAPELFFNFKSKGYSWFYTKGEYLNIGSGMRMSLNSKQYNLKHQYNDFLDVLKTINHYKGQQLAPIKGYTYAVFYGPYRYKTYRRRVFLIGDAAGFAINFTGEGIRPAIISADLAVNTIKRILTSNKELILKNIFRKYESEWKRILGIEYTFGSIAQSFYTTSLFPVFKNLIRTDETFRRLFFKMCFNVGNPRNTLRQILLRAPALAINLANQGFKAILNSLLG
jgi:geranylgeranyl reductase family protein